jgi:hypothetical protein
MFALAASRGYPKPATAAQQQILFQQLPNSPTFAAKGPLVGRRTLRSGVWQRFVCVCLFATARAVPFLCRWILNSPAVSQSQVSVGQVKMMRWFSFFDSCLFWRQACSLEVLAGLQVSEIYRCLLPRPSNPVAYNVSLRGSVGVPRAPVPPLLGLPLR